MGMGISFASDITAGFARATVRLLASEIRRTMPANVVERARATEQEQEIASAIGDWGLEALTTTDLEILASMLLDIESRYPDVVAHWNPAGRHILLEELGKLRPMVERRRSVLAANEPGTR